MFGNHGLCGLLEEGAHEKSPKCLGGNLGDFWGDFAKVSAFDIEFCWYMTQAAFAADWIAAWFGIIR